MPVIVDHEVTGLLIAPNAPEELAAAVTRLHDSPEVLAKMSVAARTKSADFTWERSIDVLEQILETAIAQHASRQDG